MPDLLIQSSTTARKDKKLADEVAQIRPNCQTQHGKNTLVECPDCFENVLEAFRSRYLKSRDDEWFTSRGNDFLQELDKMISEAKDYQLDPTVIDSRIKEERTKWYIENVRDCVEALMVGDPVTRDSLLEKLEKPPSDITDLTKELAATFKRMSLRPDADVTSISDRLSSAPDHDSRLKVLKEVFFTPPPPPSQGSNGDGGANNKKMSDAHVKYYNLLKFENLPMDQVVDRILKDTRSERAKKRAKSEKLQARLDELKRARQAHELEKKKKAKTLANSVQNSASAVSDELYNLPPCAGPGCSQSQPSTDKFFCCPVCDILVAHGVQEQRTVYCDFECRDNGHDDHMEASHGCSAKENCIQLHQDEDAIMDDDRNNSEQGMSLTTAQFCSECLNTLKQPTLWCSTQCAAQDFQAHRERVHLPERRKLKLDIAADEDQLVYGDRSEKELPSPSKAKAPEPPSTGANSVPLPLKKKAYHGKDITSHLIPFEEAVREWEKQNGVEMVM